MNSKSSCVRPCDYCGESIAVLYCRADSAKLCFSCDRQVHSTNQLFSKHTRSLICDSCDNSPATILCSTESSVLCQNCDWEKHTSSLHERRPLDPFTGCPSVNELFNILGLQEDIGKNKSLTDRDLIEGFSDFFVWDTPTFVSLDDLISSSHSYTSAIQVPPLPKNRKAACGRHKEEILSQLRELTKSEPFDPEHYLQPGNLSSDLKADDDDNNIVPSHHQWLRESSDPIYQVVPPPDTPFGTYTEEMSVKHSASAVEETHSHGNNVGTPSVPLKSETSSTTPKTMPAPYELASQERDSALLRYKQKKKTRRYDKHIRYESRKARAESRIRVRGRFAKMEH